jgi:hypothetical protein
MGGTVSLEARFPHTVATVAPHLGSHRQLL